MTTEYTAGVDSAQSNAYIWTTLLNKKDTMTMTVISGVMGKNEGDTIQSRTNYKGNTYFDVPFADREKPHSGQGETDHNFRGWCTVQRLSFYTVYTERAAGDHHRRGVISERTKDSAKLNLSANKDGDLYYLVQAVDEAVPDIAKITADGQKGSSLIRREYHRFNRAFWKSTEDLHGTERRIWRGIRALSRRYSFGSPAWRPE